MNSVFGIHVGNSNACLAIYKQDDSKDFVEVIANYAGDRVMPAVVTVTESENVVGTACKSLMVSRWSTTVTCNKLMMNKQELDTTNNGRKAVVLMRDGELCYELPLESGTVYKTPIEIASCIYSSLYEIAKSAVHGEDIDISCVLMVPSDFTEEARFRVRTAAEAVGWDVMHVINEPAAAVLGYNLLADKTPPPPQTVLVYRVGGRSCDATVIDLNHGMLSILDSEYTEDIGGKTLVFTLTKYLAEEFYRKYKLDPRESHRSLTKLTLAAENCLHVLSTIESANCFVESLCDGVDLSHSMSRARFESLLFPYLSGFAKPINTVLSRLNIEATSISKVLLCGGPLKIPRLKKFISDIFQESTTTIVSLPNGINYDEVLACGAARQAGYIALHKMRDTFLPGDIDIPLLESPVTVEVKGAECESIRFEVGQPLPVHREVKITSVSPRVTVIFSQSESPEVMLKGEVELEGCENPTNLKIEIDSETGIKVSTPEAQEMFKHHPVAMYACPVMVI